MHKWKSDRRALFPRIFVAALALTCSAIDSLRAADGPVAAKPQAPSPLFNGRDLSGWEKVGRKAAADWLVEDGCIVCRGAGHTWLRTQRSFGDFNLRLEYQLSAGANSGVYVRVPADGNHHRVDSAAPPAGFEVQILDDCSPKYAGLKDYQFSASIYDIAGANPRNTKPAGQWNLLEIDCRGGCVRVFHNGVCVAQADAAKNPALALRNTSGFLGLQSHNGQVKFRNVVVGPPR